jgi:predicted transcriptional regulator
MTATTSLKLPDDLKATIAKVAAFEGKTAHALMVDTLQTAMEDALLRQQIYADGEAAYQDTLRTNTVYAGADVKAYVMARVKTGKNGGTAAAKTGRPQAKALDATKPTTETHD